MVYFNCEACNETLKKSQVENHSYRCHAPFSCVDCGQTFHGTAYQQHTTCISEAEKYEKSVYKGPKGGKKKQNPQEIWMDILAAAAEEAQGAGGKAMTPIMRDLLPRMVEMGNVPRNEKKFKNYLNNSFRLHREKDHDELWQFLEKRRAEAQAKNDAAKEAEAQATNGVAVDEAPKETSSKVEASAEGSGKKRRWEGGKGSAAEGAEGEKKPKGKKKKGADAAGDGTGEEGKENGVPLENGAGADAKVEVSGGGFNWGKEIKRLLKKAEGRSMGLKALQKEVLAIAKGRVGGEADKKALKRVFREKVGALAGVAVEGGVVVYTKAAKT